MLALAVFSALLLVAFFVREEGAFPFGGHAGVAFYKGRPAVTADKSTTAAGLA